MDKLMDGFVDAIKVVHDQAHETDVAILKLIQELVNFVDTLNTQVNRLNAQANEIEQKLDNLVKELNG